MQRVLLLAGFLCLAVAGCGWGTAQTGAIPSKNLTPQTLFVMNGGVRDKSGSIVAGYVAAFAPPYTDAPTIIRAGLTTPLSLATDAAGNLFVGTFSDQRVNVYVPPYTGTPTTISDGVHTAIALVLDPAGNLFVLNHYLTAGDFSHGSVTEYAPPYTGPAKTTVTPSGPFAMLQDATGKLIIGRDTELDVFAPPFSGPPVSRTQYTSFSPRRFALDVAGNLFVASSGFSEGAVLILAPPYTGTPTTVGTGVSTPVAVVVDPAGALFVCNFSTSTVTEYAPPYVGPPIATINNGVNEPRDIALDRMGNLYAANSGNDTVTVYAPPYTGRPVTTISTGLKGPYGLLLSP